MAVSRRGIKPRASESKRTDIDEAKPTHHALERSRRGQMSRINFPVAYPLLPGNIATFKK